jgi:hypothetical protein
VVINIRLSERRTVTPEDRDSLGRTSYGYDEAMSPEELWAQNRGRYTLAAHRLEKEKYAAFVFEGRVVAVAEFDDYEVVDHQNSDRQTKVALVGAPLAAGDPVYDALIGTYQGRGRFTIWYTPDPLGSANVETSAVLLTWNPLNWDWGDDYLDAIDRTTIGEAVVDRWSTGSRKSGLEYGERAYLLRQGDEPKGIIGSGRVVAPVHQDQHWDGSERTANYVDVQWDSVLAPEDTLTRSELEVLFPAQDWAPQGSGTLVRPEIAEALELRWADHLNEVNAGALPPDSGPFTGQGRLLDPITRKKIEDAAQSRLMKHYEDLGWDVEDTRYGHPYDAVARSDDKAIFLEAKGTTTSGYSVTVTRGEVEHALMHPGDCVIGIWSGMTFLDDGEINPQSGAFAMRDFDPSSGVLEVIDYRWVPRA